MIFQVILAFLGSVFPAILFNIDRKKLFWAGLSGALGWSTYLTVFSFNSSSVLAVFAGTFIVGIYSEFMARRLKTPAIEFSIPGIFPLVPGITAYYTINALVEQNYNIAMTKGLLTLAAGGAIGFGIMLSATTYKLGRRILRL